MQTRHSLHPSGLHVEWTIDVGHNYVTLDAEVVNERYDRSEVSIFVTWEDLANLLETLDANPAVHNLVKVRQMQRDAEANEATDADSSTGADVHPFNSAHDRAITRQAVEGLRND